MVGGLADLLQQGTVQRAVPPEQQSDQGNHVERGDHGGGFPAGEDHRIVGGVAH